MRPCSFALLFFVAGFTAIWGQNYTFTTFAGDAGYGSADGTGSAGRFNHPVGMAVDRSGNVFIADTDNHTIRKITTDSVVTTLAGTAGISGSADGTGNTARFNSPTGVVVDGNGNLFVADSGNHTIRKITAIGVVTTLAGTAGTIGSTNATGGAARFNSPTGVAVDANGNLFVADTGNHAIRKITATGVVTTLAGTAGSSGRADGTGSAARFNSPQGVAVDGSGTMFVTDYGNSTIRQITLTGVVSTLAGLAGFDGNADGTGTAARFYQPSGVAVDGDGNFFVADTVNHTIRKITAGGVVTTLAGTAGSSGRADGTGSAARFNSPQGVAVDRSGNVFVADQNNHTIRKIAAGAVVTTLAGTADSRGSVDGPGSAARFNNPVGVAVDSTGNVYVADSNNHAIRQITAGGVVTTLAGTAASTGSADGIGTAARFNAPQGIAVDGSGNVFVADTRDHTIRKITAGGVVTTLAGAAGSPGSVNGTGSDARFSSPQGVAVDNTGNVFVADQSNHTIRKITAGGVVTTLAGTAGSSGGANGTGSAARFSHPNGVAVDGYGNVYVADIDNSTIRKITAGGVVTTLAGSAGNSGSVDGTGGAARFKFPYGVAVDGSGNVFVTDTYNTTIRKVTAGGVVTTLAGTAGTARSGISADGTGSAARFDFPWGVAVDGNGNVFIADTTNHTIRKGVPYFVPTTIVTQPQSQNVNAGARTTFNVAAAGTGLTYQWKKNGVAIAGATNSSYPIAITTASDMGFYTVLVSSGGGAVESGVAILTVVVGGAGQLINLSIRTRAGTDAQTLIVGLTIGGAGTVGIKPLLIRGVGPSLGVFGVAGFLVDPIMALMSGSNVVISNDDWAGSPQVANMSAQVGAFGFSSTASKDAALVTALSLGGYTVQITGVGSTTGVALAEIYDATPAASFTATTPRLTNISARAQVGTGDEILIAGFTIGGSAAKTVLIRAIGPTLTAFGVPGVLADPKLELYSGTNLLNSNDDWGGATAISAAAASVGAFALGTTTKDAVILTTLPPGGYTVQVSGVGNTTGVALIELYEVPTAAVSAPTAPQTSMVLIPAGTFTMGDNLDGDSNAPTHAVTLSAFYLARTETTTMEWDDVRAWAATRGYTDLPSGDGKATTHPVRSVSWYDVVKWLNAKSEKDALVPVYCTNDAQTTVYRAGSVNVTIAQVKWTANGYRLPTEAEWEYAARGGLTGKRFPWGDTITHQQANYSSSAGYAYDLSPTRGFHPTYAAGSQPDTSPVGSFAANGYGLVDMAGNVTEWCWDWYGSGSYGRAAVTAPRGPTSGTVRVLRGGSLINDASWARSADRGYGPAPSHRNGDVGFRPARSSVP